MSVAHDRWQFKCKCKKSWISAHYLENSQQCYACNKMVYPFQKCKKKIKPLKGVCEKFFCAIWLFLTWFNYSVFDGKPFD